MIIATANYERDKILALKDNYDGLCDYIKSLVPPRYRHVDAIYHNTRYYLNMQVLQDNKIPLDVKTQLSKLLTKQIRVVGYMDGYVTCSQLERAVNMNRVQKYYEGDKHEQSC